MRQTLQRFRQAPPASLASREANRRLRRRDGFMVSWTERPSPRLECSKGLLGDQCRCARSLARARPPPRPFRPQGGALSRILTGLRANSASRGALRPRLADAPTEELWPVRAGSVAAMIATQIVNAHVSGRREGGLRTLRASHVGDPCESTM